jgi:carboxypeptidase Q
MIRNLLARLKRACGAALSGPRVATAIVLVAASTPLVAQETVNDAVVAQIKAQAFQESAVMDTLSWLSDVHGPRLTGSPTSGRAIS